MEQHSIKRIESSVTGILPNIAEQLCTDPSDARDFILITVRLLRKKQLERADVQAKLLPLAEWREVAR